MVLFLLIGYILFSVGMYFVFPKCGVEAWKGITPGLNLFEFAGIVGRKKSHAWWMFFPIVNIFIFSALIIDLARSFGKHSFWQHVLAVVGAPFYSIWLGLNKENTFEGAILPKEHEYFAKLKEAHEKNDNKTVNRLQSNSVFKKSPVREWAESIIFAVFAAAFIRMFLIEAYMIPTSSMEGSLKVGDFLFVSKAHYGVRLPQTFIMLPLLHNRIPFLNTESYIANPHFGYHRLPKLQEVQRFEPFVFNWPVGDSVYLSPERSFTADQVRRNPGIKSLIGDAELIVRPVDKKDHYIKRCVGLPGDSIKIVNRQLYVNNIAAPNATHQQFLYNVMSPTNQINPRLMDRLGVNLKESYPNQSLYFLDSVQVRKIKAMDTGMIIRVYPQDHRNDLFPFDTPLSQNWTVDNYGPIYIPKAGTTTPLNLENLSTYSRIISVYEHNKLDLRDGKIYINDQESTSYTFKMNYYWAMGDNRHNSEDSRAWGFVPEDHIVGKPLFIWFSTKNGAIKNGINWDRLFTSANKK